MGIGVGPYAGRFHRKQATPSGTIDVSGPVQLFDRGHDVSLGLSGNRSVRHGTDAFATGLSPIASIFDIVRAASLRSI